MDHDQSSNAESTGPAIEGVRWWNRYGARVTAGVLLFLVAGGTVLFTVPDLLLKNWFPDLTTQQRAAFLGPATTAVLFALGGIIALVGVGLSFSRHHQELEAAARDRERLNDDREREQVRRGEVDAQRRIETERALRERFVATVKLLSDPAPVNRQAALFALGALADDWDAFGKPDEVQVCIEVLTGYLRAPRSEEMLMPLTREQNDQFDSSDSREAQRTTPQEISVKQAGYTVIGRHLRDDATPHWHDRNLNLAGAHIDFEVNLLGATITDRAYVNFKGATITDRAYVNFNRATITDRAYVDFDRATMTGYGTVGLSGATISNRATVTFIGATITNRGVVTLADATISDSETNVGLGGATITDSGIVDLSGATITHNAYMHLDGATITDSGSLYLDRVTISDRGVVTIYDTTITDSGTVALRDVTITDTGVMSFRGAILAGNVFADILAATVRGGGSVTLPDGTPHPRVA